MIRKLMIAFVASAATGAAFIPASASADWWGYRHRDIRADRFDIHRDRVDLRHDWRDLGRDVRYGTRGDIARDIADIRHDGRDLRRDRYDLYWDRRGY